MKPEPKSKPTLRVKNEATGTIAPKDPTKKLLAITLSTIVSLLAIGTIFIVVLSSIKVDPTERFYAAFEKNMSTKYVHQKYTTTGSFFDSNMNMLADSYTDFSDVKAPKTKAHLIVDIADTTVVDVNLIATKNYADYVKINQFGDGKDEKPLQFDKNTWYALDSASEASNIDMFQLASSINITYGESLSGNYNAADRAALIKMYKDKKAFTFDSKKDVKETTVHSEKVFVYSVKMNAAAVKAVNDEAAKRLGLTPTPHDFKDQDMTIAISANTGRFVQIVLKENTLASTLDIDYPASLEITIPKDTKPYSSLRSVKSQGRSNSY